MPTPRPPLVIAHRGASGHLPEHTLEAFALAARMGADYLEPDVVPTADGVLVVRHENDISATTDVASRPDFADRHTTRTVDGRRVAGWFTEDFTLEELRRLRAVERLPHLRPTSADHDGAYAVPTLVEVLALRARLSAQLGRTIGVYVEAKHPGHFAARGLPVEHRILADLEATGLLHAGAPVYLQCFEAATLAAWRRAEVPVPLVALVHRGTAGRPGPQDLVPTTPEGLDRIRLLADALGPEKELVVPRGADGLPGEPTGLVAAAHGRGLAVHPWTFRAENAHLPRGLRRGQDPAAPGDLRTELEAHLTAGVDAVFTDHPDVGVSVRDAWVACKPALAG